MAAYAAIKQYKDDRRSGFIQVVCLSIFDTIKEFVQIVFSQPDESRVGGASKGINGQMKLINEQARGFGR